MAVTKTEVVSARIPPDVKTALVTAAQTERRSVASMLAVMVLSYCRDHGITAVPAARPPRPRAWMQPPAAPFPAEVEEPSLRVIPRGQSGTWAALCERGVVSFRPARLGANCTPANTRGMAPRSPCDAGVCYPAGLPDCMGLVEQTGPSSLCVENALRNSRNSS